MASRLLFLLPRFQLAGNVCHGPGWRYAAGGRWSHGPAVVPPDAAHAAQYPARMHLLKYGYHHHRYRVMSSSAGLGSVLATILMGFTPEKNRAVGARCKRSRSQTEHRARRPLTGSVVNRASPSASRWFFVLQASALSFYFCCFRPAPAVCWHLLVRLRNRLFFRARERVGNLAFHTCVRVQVHRFAQRSFSD
ncbi:Uncharacterised protein [Escherichia coli]|uniref:Uncharacterized protein n=1 Tax=Escherichia coli TaxID=562 RepID=A0A376J4M1_ECOLX|nr:Uncharacterised protein [Escherichia coli]